MLNLIWSNQLTPTAQSPVGPKTYEVYPSHFEIPLTRAIEKEDKDLGELPDRRAIRSMSRASVMLSSVCLQGKEIIAPYVQAAPFEVGIYCAINHGPEDYQCAKDLIGCPQSEFAARYKKSRSPKHYLKQLPNLEPAQLGIFLGIMGPVNTFNHSTQGAYQAMEHAEFDIRTNKVKVALVCSAFSLEDPLLSLKTRTEAPKDSILTEGAVAFLFTAAQDSGTSFVAKLDKFRNVTDASYFGIANPFMHFFKKGI